MDRTDRPVSEQTRIRIDCGDGFITQDRSYGLGVWGPEHHEMASKAASEYAVRSMPIVCFTARIGESEICIEKTFQFPEIRSDSAAAARLWAGQRIRDLLDKGGAEADAEIIRLSKAHRVATPRTAFLIL